MQRSPRFDPAESDREFSIAASDYAVTILADPLLRLVKRTAPRIRLNLHPLPAGLPASSQALSTEDLLIGPVGYDFPGRHAELFRDRFVCVVDASNARLRDGRLTLDDLSRMPHAAPTFAPGSRTPVDRVLDELGIAPRVRVTVFGWLSVPFVLAGTEMVAIMPERMARLAVRGAPLAVLEPPFGLVELVEAAYWHPSRSDDPAVRWLLSTMKEAARELLPGFRSSTKQYGNAFLPAAPNVSNITVQKQCILDGSDHLEIAADPVALADMLNALDPSAPRESPLPGRAAGHRPRRAGTEPLAAIPVRPACCPAGSSGHQ
jgi:DNA-binding transcriptional LysR family regulator